MAVIKSEAIEQSLKKVRPYLKVDGGDVEFVRMTPEGIVEVRLLGSCVLCPMSIMTLRAGIERSLMLEYQEVKRVEQVR
jgi:Fe-S cluster biogenesis protein NfuA